MSQPLITQTEREAVYKTIFGRRDVRKYFKPDPVPHEILARILKAAHHAGSVGFMQPWNFIVIDDERVKAQVHSSFLKEREEAACRFDPDRRQKYLSYKLEGILEAPLNLCVTCDHARFGPEVLGRHSIPETDVYSTVCAVQNLWLAARAENVGVGWVSILKRDDLHRILGIPETLTIVAYLCLGFVTEFPEDPDLETLGWAKRGDLEKFIYFNGWEGKPTAEWKDFAVLL